MEVSTLESKVENPDAKPDMAKLASIAQSAKADSAGAPAFMQPGTKVKNKGGRPRKDGSPAQPRSEAPKPKTPKTGSPSASVASTPSVASQDASVVSQPPVPGIPSAKIAEPAVKLLSRLGQGIAQDPRAAMSPSELEDVSQALGMLMDKWMPTVMTQYGAEAMFVMALTNWGTRVYALRQLKAEADAAAQTQPTQEQHEAFVRAEKPAPAPNVDMSMDPDAKTGNAKPFRPPVSQIGATDFFAAASKNANEYRV